MKLKGRLLKMIGLAGKHATPHPAPMVPPSVAKVWKTDGMAGAPAATLNHEVTLRIEAFTEASRAES